MKMLCKNDTVEENTLTVHREDWKSKSRAQEAHDPQISTMYLDLEFCFPY